MSKQEKSCYALGLLTLLLVFLWGMSWIFQSQFAIPISSSKYIALTQERGDIRISFWRWVVVTPQPPQFVFERISSTRYSVPENYWYQYYPSAATTTKPGGYGYRFVQFPHLLPTCITGIVTIVLFIGIWRQKKNMNCCTKCGYDLRGNPNSKNCPECGTTIVFSSTHH